MALITIPVLFRYHQQNGQPHVGVVVEAKLTRQEIDNGVLLEIPVVVGTTDDAGECTLSLWPNSRGSGGSQYTVSAFYNGESVGSRRITVPEVGSGSWPVMAETIVNAAPFPPVSASQAALAAAQEAVVVVQGFANDAAASAGAADASAQDAAASAGVAGDHAAQAGGSSESAGLSAQSASDSAAGAQVSALASASRSQDAALSELNAFNSAQAALGSAQSAAQIALQSEHFAGEAEASALASQASADASALSATLIPIAITQLATNLIATQAIVVQHHGFT